MKKVVTIGGGTGSFTILRGLKQYPFTLTALVNTFDSGGSSGVLRDEYGILPPGDIRRCLLALADDTAAPTIRELFNYRFDREGGLQGHNFGNLLLTALTQITGNYPEAIDKAANILNVKGKIYPISLELAHLNAELEDGQIISGETNIDIPKHDPFLKIKNVALTPQVTIFDAAYEAIINADLIILCPGDIYTSLIPNLLVQGVTDALRKTKAKKVYICNLMTKLGETQGFKASQFAQEVLSYAGLKKFDYIICNNKEISSPQYEKYVEENKYPVEVDEDVTKFCHQLITAPVVSDGDVLRHDSHKVGEIIATFL